VCDRLAYQELVGGVLAMRTEHFQRLNGYSNLYWGWGAEDDDMAYRSVLVVQWQNELAINFVGPRPPDNLEYSSLIFLVYIHWTIYTTSVGSKSVT